MNRSRKFRLLCKQATLQAFCSYVRWATCYRADRLCVGWCSSQRPCGKVAYPYLQKFLTNTISDPNKPHRLGLCLTNDLGTFTAISFITAVTTVTPQLMLPLVGDLAPPNKRAAALSIVVSGLMLGVLVARVLSGTMTNFVTWRAVYWMALGLQYIIFVLLWCFMPDYPATNPGMNYFSILWDIVKMLFKHPALVQACLAGLFCSAPFTSFWTTLTFLLAGEPYHYSSLTIGLFGLIGIAGMLGSPVYARLVTDKFVPHFSVLFGLGCSLIGICLGTYVGRFNVAGPVLQALLMDFGNQTAQIANRSSIYSIEPKRRNGLNTAFMVSTFCGQLIGTAAGNHIYAAAGWIGSGSASVGFISAAILVILARGPWEEKWIGWRGGWSMRKKDPNSANGKTSEKTRFHEGKVRDEEMGAEKKVLEEVAAEPRNMSPLDVDETDQSLKSSDDEVRPVKIG
jgi:predicted MFS family arabinose efflux permease